MASTLTRICDACGHPIEPHVLVSGYKPGTGPWHAVPYQCHADCVAQHLNNLEG